MNLQTFKFFLNRDGFLSHIENGPPRVVHIMAKRQGITLTTTWEKNQCVFLTVNGKNTDLSELEQIVAGKEAA